MSNVTVDFIGNAAADKRCINVLLVDDIPASLLALEAALGALDEKLVKASSRDEAIELVRREDFAVILLAIRMPGMDGLEAARLIRAIPRARSTPIIFMSGADQSDGGAAAYAMGGVDFVTEPVVPEIVRAKVGVFVELCRGKEQLRGERAFLQAVLERVEDAIVATDATGAPTLVNRAARELFEHTGIARPCELFRANAIESPIERVLRGEQAYRVEVQLGAGPGKRLMDTRSAPLLDAEGRVAGVVISLHDITAVRNVQTAQTEALFQIGRREEAEAATDQLRDSQEGLRRLAAELSEADRRKTEFLATLAHELRNPLAPLTNGLELLRIAEDRPELRARTRDMMERQIKQLVRLVDDLLEVARITSGKVQLQREVVELSQIIRSAVESCAPALQQHRHSFHVDLPQQPVYVNGDTVRLTQVFCNLLNNAAKYTPDGGEVALAARVENHTVTIEVTDNGVGIPAKALPQVFDMFTQVERNIFRSDGGLGIGLALVRSLVEMHGGRVAALSPGLGRGSTFCVVLPTTRAAVEGAAEAFQAPALHTYRILVVDDNIDAADSLAAVLETRGHSVAVAHDGQEALDKAGAFEPQVVFLDIGMPRMNGYEVARALRSTSFGARAILVALTGWGAERDRDRTLEAGFDHHLTKPGSTSAISQLVDGFEGDLRRRSKRAATPQQPESRTPP
ncbi:response regulator [Ramlibacter sp.]|uniref:hybrid sensor histidine kinase/response regulator n=1 Tax=Ramlibacter sp. TaxID=1917967 RepID=UPI0017F18751|nr:response regulator [Ramlibacter sp.]MBA2676156.1 response regulator [Ramlibacter sp.]